MLKPLPSTIYPITASYMAEFCSLLESMPERLICTENKDEIRKAATENSLPDLDRIRGLLPDYFGTNIAAKTLREMYGILDACEQMLLSSFTLYLQEASRILSKDGLFCPSVVSFRHFSKYKAGTRYNCFRDLNNAFTTYMETSGTCGISTDEYGHIKVSLECCREILEAVHGYRHRFF